MATKKKEKKSAGISLWPIVLFFGTLGLAFTVYIIYRAAISPTEIFSVGVLALFSGLLFESMRIAKDPLKVIAIFIGAYFLSFGAFLPGKNETNYDFDYHIQAWYYAFIFFYATLFGVVFQNKVTIKLTEGITLLLSISMIYWAVDYGFINYHNWFSFSLIIIGSVLTVFSFVHALTSIELSRTNRLILSIWSTAISFAFAVDNIIRVLGNSEPQPSESLPARLVIAVQFFLLGVSAIYIVQNFILLAAFLPSKHGNYWKDLKRNKKDHIERYSDKQVNTRHSIYCIAFAGIVYTLNHIYQFLPRHTIVWLVLFTFPFVIQIETLLNRLKSRSDV